MLEVDLAELINQFITYARSWFGWINQSIHNLC